MSTSEKQPPLTCQELSKQCNDIDSSSSQLCGRWKRKSLHKNLSNGSCQPSVQRKVSVGSVSHSLEQYSEIRPSGTRFYKSRLEALSKELEMLSDQSVVDDDGDDDDDDDWGEDWDNGQRGTIHSSGYRWLPHSDEMNDHVHEQHDFLDEIESTLHSQVDGEIEVFRSNLHSMIRQQQHQCRQLLNQELEESYSKMTKMIPSNVVSDEQSSSPCQTVPHDSGSQDTWSSDFLQNSSDQQKIEAMSTSTSRIQGDEGSVHFIPNLGSTNGPSLDAELNRLTLQLLTSALTISNALHREEYTT